MQPHNYKCWKRTLVSLFATAILASTASVAQKEPSPLSPTRARATPNLYQSSNGYSLTYPPGWQKAKRSEIGDADVDVLIHAPSTDTIRYFNVIVSPNIFPATQYSLGEFRRNLTEQISRVSVPRNLDVRLTKVGRHDAIVATWTSSMPGNGNWWQEQFLIPGDSHTFIVTCTSEAGTSTVAEPIFNKILATFEIHETPRSGPVHEILQEAKSRQPEDDKIRASLKEVMARQPQSFPEFKRQCADLRSAMDESDALEKRKRRMLTNLRSQFGNDSRVKDILDMLVGIEDSSDKMESVLRSMITCSGILESAPSIKHDGYHEICIGPAQQQLNLIFPEIRDHAQRLQDEIQKYGGTLPPDVLRMIAQ